MAEFVYRDQKKMRCGFTTGSCAAAAAKGAAMLLFSGIAPKFVELQTPKGTVGQFHLLDVSCGDGWASCAVRKDAGDDPDVTDGVLVYAHVAQTDGTGIVIDGGLGIGRVTKAGLDQPVGAAAINATPRKMIADAIAEVQEEWQRFGGLRVEISIPAGVALAAETCNPQLGIVGGISVLGTSGVVEPMSEQALLETIRTECRVRRAAGEHFLLTVPGNYGETFLQQFLPNVTQTPVKCSNFIGDTIDIAISQGFTELLLVGHIGKLVKVGGGMLQTHSRYSDGRMETLAACGIRCGLPGALLRELLECVTTDGALALLRQHGVLEPVMAVLSERIDYYLQRRANGKLEIGAVFFSREYGLLGKTETAQRWLEEMQ